jgi:hypothetical protein
MDLGSEERYAAAALFTLALHLTQVRGNNEPTNGLMHSSKYPGF